MPGEAIRKAYNQVPLRQPPRLRAYRLLQGSEARRCATEATVWLHQVNGDPITGKDKKEMRRELGLAKADEEGTEIDEDIRASPRAARLPEFNMEMSCEDPSPHAMARAYLDGLSEVAFSASAQSTSHGLVATRWEIHAKHTGELLGVAPSGRMVSFAGITLVKFTEFPGEGEDGKRIFRATDEWTYWDLPGLMEQIGATP